MTRFKICGISQAEHAVAAADAGADFVGFIFAPSKRQVTPDRARELVREAKSARPNIGRKPELVGIFVNQPAAEINEIVTHCGLNRVQLHGDETLQDCEAIHRSIFKVIRIDAGRPSEELMGWLEREVEAVSACGYVPMLDTVSTGPYYGGTGRPVDWKAASEVARKHQILLSGGLSPDIVAPAIEQVRPWGVDVSSGVETGGAKDAGKMNAFAKAIRRVDEGLAIR